MQKTYKLVEETIKTREDIKQREDRTNQQKRKVEKQKTSNQYLATQISEQGLIKNRKHEIIQNAAKLTE